MKNFEIVNLNEEVAKILVVMKISESPFDFAADIQEQLKMIGFCGIIVIDELLHSGNNEERFISGFFDGNTFDNSKFRFECVSKKSRIRNYVCEYLQSDLEALRFSSLTDKQQKLISHGCVI